MEPRTTRRPPGSRIAESLERRTLLAGVAYASPVTTSLVTSQNTVTQVAVADLNGDKIPDLVAGRRGGSAQVFLGTVTGTFTSKQILGSAAQVIALGDFTGDGKIDLATAGGVFVGNGDGTFGQAVPNFVLPLNTYALYAGDVNGDGKLDLVAATYTQPTSTTGPGLPASPAIALDTLIGAGNGTFAAPVVTPVASSAGLAQSMGNFVFADVNKDKVLDAISPFGVQLGTGTAGAFAAPIALPLKVAGSKTTSLPSGSEIAVGDIDGDGNPDLVTLPATTSTTTPTTAGQVELLRGDGKGGFRDAGPISVGSTTATVTSITTADANGDGSLDLIVGTSDSGTLSTGAGNALAVLLNSGTGTFTAAPLLFTVPGAPSYVTTGDFNADGQTDLLSVNGPAGGVAGTGASVGLTTASVLLNSQAAAKAPTLNLRLSATRAVVGTPVQYTVTVQAPTTTPPFRLGATPATPTPSGSVTFYDGTTALGTLPLQNGKATLATTAQGVGPQSITVAYSGDANYTAATSAAVIQTVLLTAAQTPLLLPTLGAVNFPATFVPGDNGTVAIPITNAGGATANGRVAVNFYLSQDGAIDASSIPLNATGTRNVALHLPSGKATTLTGRFTAGSYPAGAYALLAQVVPLTGLTADQLAADTVASGPTIKAAGLAFGAVGTHKNLIARIANATGQTATLTLTGPGTGTVTQAADGQFSVALTGTTAASHVHITSRGGAFSFDTISAAAPLGTLDAARFAVVTGALTLTGGVKQIALASVNNPASNAVPITVGKGTGKTQASLALGNVGNAMLTAAGPIATLSAAAWAGGFISAPSIGTLAITGTFAADVNVHAGGKLVSAKLGAITGGSWAIAGGIGTLRVNTSIANARIIAGADAGPDETLGTRDDVFAPATIASILIAGSDTSTLIAAGVTPATAGAPIDAGLTLLSGGAIRGITVRGTISDDSRFLAAALPAAATLSGMKVKPVADPHFQVGAV